MTRGMYDEVEGHEVPGYRIPTGIMSSLDRDELHVPDTVQDGLRRARADEAWVEAEADAIWRRDLELSVHPPEPPPPEAPAVSPPSTRPTVVALTACTMALLSIECLLVALRVGGAYDWRWGLVLAPVWVPVSVAIIVLTVICVWLAAMDEHEAARRDLLIARN